MSASNVKAPRPNATNERSGMAAHAVVNPPPPRPNPPAPPAAPTGRKLVGNIGPGTLNPGAGKTVQRTQRPLYCGTMTGQAFDVSEHANAKDPARISLRFAGEIMAITATGEVLRGMEWYLPPTVARAVKAALKVNGGTPIPFSIEIWCMPDEPGRPASPLGYSYVSYDRSPVGANDAVMALAVAAGILPPSAPQAALTASEPEQGEHVDPETGEVGGAPSQPATAAA